jgi:hypothetical protein
MEGVEIYVILSVLCHVISVVNRQCVQLVTPKLVLTYRNPILSNNHRISLS